MGDRMNLFSLIFKLLGQKKIPAYEYTLDGAERLTADNDSLRMCLTVSASIGEQRKLKDRRDSVLVIETVMVLR